MNTPCDANSRRIVRNALRALRREYGTECVFSFKTILEKTLGSKIELQRILDGMSKTGEVFCLGDSYRIN